ncbi:phage antirepressor protein KilAC domain-containing protein [Microcella alkaliphila]|uniref:Phage antirepressor protein KilAC domain-containing protein n=1 Tax=Microcella alkaliphila TaxID=279828 RepID=A0A4Q7TFW2_9MICO|nr:phage antirepressor KilAC domain-containing protein [Microcella alkaliphila]RZT59354.1 phage antirepressor protein KilAC domain-containing protein [Microcella alkaliphila]
MSDEPRTVVVPFRWTGHGIDIRAVLTDGDSEPRFVGPDIYTALELIDDNRDLLTVAEVVALVNRFPNEQRLEFLVWFDEIRQELVDGVFYAIVTRTPFGRGPVDDGHHSISEAADILSRDPVIRVSRDELFRDLLRDYGWTMREPITGAWIPTDRATNAGWLARDQTRGRTDRIAYPQVRVTRAGLEELHRRLGGIAALHVDDHHPQLIEPTA